MKKHWPSRFLVRLFWRRSAGQLTSGTPPVEPKLDNSLRFAHGQAQPEDSPEVVQGVGKAAESGNAEAQNSFGLMFASGDGVLKSGVEARKWFRRAAEQGDPGAQFNLGNLCHPASLGHLAVSVGEAKIEAYMWFHLAAAQGYSNAEASCEMLNLQMTDAELHEGNRRADAFRPRQEKRD
jgi:uncharacterized protein